MRQTNKEEGLVALGALKRFRVAKGEPDVRGWEVVTSDHKKIGDVHELIIDTTSMKVRYLDIAIGKKILGTDSTTHMLIPIAGATLDDDDNRVYLSEVTAQALAAIPPYDHRVITREFETMLTRIYATDSGSAPVVPAEKFYEREVFDDKRFWAKRRKGREEKPYVDRSSEAPLEDETEVPMHEDRPLAASPEKPLPDAEVRKREEKGREEEPLRKEERFT